MYAKDTGVSTDRSEAELKRVLRRYGADQIATMETEDTSGVAFRFWGRGGQSLLIRIMLPLPSRDAEEFALTPTGRKRKKASDCLRAWEQACRQRWRALVLYVKAKLEAVERGIVSVEGAFLAHVVLPDNQTVGQWLEPQLASAHESDKMPKALPSL